MEEYAMNWAFKLICLEVTFNAHGTDKTPTIKIKIKIKIGITNTRYNCR